MKRITTLAAVIALGQATCTRDTSGDLPSSDAQADASTPGVSSEETASEQSAGGSGPSEDVGSEDVGSEDVGSEDGGSGESASEGDVSEDGASEDGASEDDSPGGGTSGSSGSDEASSRIDHYDDVTDTHLPDGLRVSSMDAEFVDVEQDGDLDIVIAVENGPNLLLINDGSGRFSHSDALSDLEGDSEDIGIGDFDNDGHADIIFAAEESRVNEFYLGDGAGGFIPANDRIPVANRSNAVFVDDINRDGALDIIIGNSGGNGSDAINSILINDGAAHFTNESPDRLPMVTDETQDILMVRINGDDINDMLVANEDDNRMYFGSEDGTFSDETHRLPLRPGIKESTREVAVADVDMDGDNDILYLNNGGDRQNRLLINDGAGNFSDETENRLPQVELRTWDGAFYDVNNDSFPDIITANSTPDVMAELYEVYINDGSGVFEDQTELLFPAGVRESGWDVEGADLNGDGYLDLYLCARSNDKVNGVGSQDRLLFSVPE
ncbi:MAG: VCBS repeat-containing protein [Nannocystaceae bacterium]